MNVLNNHPNCWPTRRQELLLKASLLQGAGAVCAWEEWKSGVDFERLDPGSERLLPLLYHNLNKQDPITDGLKRTYLQTWYKNQILFHKAGALLTAFHNAGIPTMMLKGAALTLLYYKNYGLRPMGDIDVLVPTNRAVEAISLLKEMNWTTNAESPERLISLVHGMDFHNASGQSIDLHWHVIHECRQEDADDDFWESAVSVKIENVQTLALCPADQLLHVFAHGVRWSEVPPFRWVADAMTVINSSQSEVDWNR